MKQEYLQFIKNFSSISVSRICKEKKVDRSCLLTQRTSEEKTKIVYDELMKQLKALIKAAEVQKNGKNNTI